MQLALATLAATSTGPYGPVQFGPSHVDYINDAIKLVARIEQRKHEQTVIDRAAAKRIRRANRSKKP